MTKANKHLNTFSSLLALSLISANALAGFNVYDARTLAMGNTSVAVANTDIAYFYNPSLLAFHYEDEDKARDGRLLAPNAVFQFSDAVEDVYDLIDKELDTQFDDAIQIYNATPSGDNARRAGGLARDIDDIVQNIKGKDLTVDSYIGFGASEVGELRGGSFFVGSRFIGGGLAEISEADEDLFDQYIGALDFVADGGSDCAGNAEFANVLNPDCTLQSPNGRFNSVALFRGAIVAEAGVSFSQLFQWKDFLIAAGASPKVMMLQAIDENRPFNEENYQRNTDLKSHFFLNTDVGFSVQYKERLRLGLSVKDLIARDFDTELGNKVEIQPAARMGFSYLHPRFSIGADYDLEKTQSFAGEAERQDFSLGAEISIFELTHLRFGYRTDTENNYDDVTSAGIGFGWRYIFVDLAYASSKEQNNYALQIGFTF